MLIIFLIKNVKYGVKTNFQKKFSAVLPTFLCLRRSYCMNNIKEVK